MFEANRIAEVTHEAAKGATEVAIFALSAIATGVVWAGTRGAERLRGDRHPLKESHIVPVGETTEPSEVLSVKL